MASGREELSPTGEGKTGEEGEKGEKKNRCWPSKNWDILILSLKRGGACCHPQEKGTTAPCIKT